MKHSDFLSCFDIPEDEFNTPGRDYDEDGNLCSWYVERQPAQLTYERLIGLILILNTWCDTACTSTREEALKDEVESKIISTYKKLSNSKNKKDKAVELKQAILDLFIRTQEELEYD